MLSHFHVCENDIVSNNYYWIGHWRTHHTFMTLVVNIANNKIHTEILFVWGDSRLILCHLYMTVKLHPIKSKVNRLWKVISVSKLLPFPWFSMAAARCYKGWNLNTSWQVLMYPLRSAQTILNVHCFSCLSYCTLKTVFNKNLVGLAILRLKNIERYKGIVWMFV